MAGCQSISFEEKRNLGGRGFGAWGLDLVRGTFFVPNIDISGRNMFSYQLAFLLSSILPYGEKDMVTGGEQGRGGGGRGLLGERRGKRCSKSSKTHNILNVF